MTNLRSLGLVGSTSGGGVIAPHSLKPAAKVVTRAQSGHGMTGGADDATGSFLFGNAYKVTTNGAGGSTFVGPPIVTAYDVTGKFLRIRVRIDDVARLNAFQIYVTTGPGNTFTGSVNQTLISGQSDWITLPRATASGTNSALWTNAAGTPIWTGVTKVEIRVTDKGGSAPLNLWVEALEWVNEETAYPNGVFVLEADDGFAGQVSNLVPVVDARSVPVTFNPIAERIISGTNTWTVAMLQDRVAKAGWEIACHAYAQAVHDYAAGAVPVATATADWTTLKAWMRTNGLLAGVDDFATNPGTGSPVPEGALLTAMRANFKSARFNSGFIETQRPADPYKLRSVLFSGNSNANLQTNIDQACAQGGMFVLTLHDVLTGSTNGTSNSLPAIAANNLATILDYAIGKGMAFRTRSDALAGR